MSRINIEQIFEDNKEKLGLSWSQRQDASQYELTEEMIAQSTQGVVGHLNFIHPNWLQVLSATEIEYLSQLDAVTLETKIQSLSRSHVACIIVAGSAEIPAPISAMATQLHTPLMQSTSSSLEIIWLLRAYLGRVLSPSVSLHGVMLDVLGVGVMITGDSGVGKSELALELISRGHGLVADDVVELRRIAPETLEGRCPPMLRDFLEVRGLGMLNIRAIFGETAVRRAKNMKLIVHLQNPSGPDASIQERLPISNLNETIMSVDIRKVIIPVAAGRNLAVLVEAAVRNFILQLRGIDSTQDFIKRHEQEMEQIQAEQDS